MQCVCGRLIFAYYSKDDYRPDGCWIYYPAVIYAILIGCDLFNDVLDKPFFKAYMVE
jgi:hypothetical protein